MNAQYMPRGFRGFLWRMRRWMNGQPMYPSNGLVVLPVPRPIESILPYLDWPALLARADSMEDFADAVASLPGHVLSLLEEWSEFSGHSGRSYRWNMPELVAMVALIAYRVGATDPVAAQVAATLLRDVPPQDAKDIEDATRYLVISNAPHADSATG